MHDTWITHSLEMRDMPRAHMLSRQWLVSNGAGSYAMGTAAGCNQSRYHGLLVASARPPVARQVVLSQMLEQLIITDADGREVYEFATCTFRDQTTGQSMQAPAGWDHLISFERGLHVAWTYQVQGLRLIRKLVMHPGQPAATLVYTVEGLEDLPAGARVQLRLVPMLALRDFHHLLHAGQMAPFEISLHDPHRLSVQHNDLMATLRCQEGTFHHEPGWWYRFFYAIDHERGQDDQEDLFVPGRYDIALDRARNAQVVLTVALGEDFPEHVTDAATRCEQLQAVAAHLRPMASSDAQARLLAIASDDFVVQRSFHGRPLATILAGYPWFADWGRDTFIALPGLLLATGRMDQARAVLEAFGGAIRRGLVPNRFDDYDDSAAHYNTVDASLWFVHAAMQYLHLSNDTTAWDAFLGHAVTQVLDAYLDGTDFAIAVDPADGLVTAGDPHTQLTWMDAATGGVVFTPRHGKAVEINALWYNALKCVLARARNLPQAAVERYSAAADKAKAHFTEFFWNEKAQCLFDHRYQDGKGQWIADASIRPNQIFAVSLPHSPLQPEHAAAVVRVVAEKLLTPMGLRTLPSDDPYYHPWYVGDQFHRDEAYHQGTIWPWLIGPYAQAVLRAGDFSPQARQQAHQAIAGLLAFMEDEGLGQLYEVHEAATLRPVGCMAQAWSVAEVTWVLHLLQEGSTS